MDSEHVRGLATELRTEYPERLWGISPESTYAALNAMATDESLESVIDRYRRLELAATNEERDREIVIEFHRSLLRGLGLIEDDAVTELGAFILCGDEPNERLRTLVATHAAASRRLLRDCLVIDDTVPRREYEALLRDEYEENVVTPLLGSFGLIRVFRDGIEVVTTGAHRGLDAYNAVDQETARAALHRRILPSILGIDEATATDVTTIYLGQEGDETLSGAEIIGSLAGDPPECFDREAVQAAATEVRAVYEQAAVDLTDLLTHGNEGLTLDRTTELTVADIEDQVEIEASTALLDVLATVAERRLTHIYIGYVATRLDTSTYDAFKTLNAVPGCECELRDEIVEIHRLPKVVDGTNRYDQYVRYLLDEYATVTQRIDRLTDPEFAVEGLESEEILAKRVDTIDDRQVAPTYFTYTLINPDSLGEETMEEYVGDSQSLGQERARLRRWHETRSSGLRSYTAMTDRLFSLGLETDLDHQVLRIMTPFDDDTFSEYAAQLRRLLEEGYELRLLTRHTKEPWEWRRLRDNLLARLESNRDRVSIRTYSRFKTHQQITSGTDISDLNEIGIHGKLHVIGGADEGAALLGSANFMENSYHWNPECGVYTERSPFVESALEFFDVVWELAEVDQLSLDRLQEIPQKRFIPSYYT